MEILVIVIAVFIIVIAVMNLFSKGKESEAVKNINLRIKTNTADLLMDFNEKASERGMNIDKFKSAQAMLNQI